MISKKTIFPYMNVLDQGDGINVWRWRDVSESNSVKVGEFSQLYVSLDNTGSYYVSLKTFHTET